MRRFVGRKEYLERLHNLWSSQETKLISIYGRRRVGKTAIIQHFSGGKRAFLFEAIEGEDTQGQIKHFLGQVSRFTSKPYIRDLAYKDWPPVFDLFTEILSQEKSIVVCFDELSWMAAGRSKLVSYIKFYWDKHWKQHRHLFFILCGSVASWMIKNVVKASALYGRISENILVEPLQPSEVCEFIGKKRGQKEVLEYYLCFGGIPKYLEEFDFHKSIQLNVENTCFHPAGFFTDEADKIFYNQFKETGTYKKIVAILFEKPLSLQDISRKVRLPSGGGLKLYMDNLMSAGIVGKKADVKGFKLVRTPYYFIMDEFLHFHHYFIRPNLDEIRFSSQPGKFEKLTLNKWDAFLGRAFERFCVRQRYVIAQLLGFGNKVVGCGSVLEKGTGGYQFDLVYLRRDHVVTLCEIKYLSSMPSTKIIKEFEDKISGAKFPRGVTLEKVLISNQPPSPSLTESGYFHSLVTADAVVRFPPSSP